MAITRYEAILHSIIKTEAEWQRIDTVIPENQWVYAIVSKDEQILNFYAKLGDGTKPFRDLPKASLSIQDIMNMISSSSEGLQEEIERATQAESKLSDRIDEKLNKNYDSNIVYGTDSEGNQTTYELDSFGKVDNVLVDGVSVVENKIAKIILANKIEHYSELPNASENLGKIVQYSGETTPEYTQGYFYQSISKHVDSNLVYTTSEGLEDKVSVNKEQFETLITESGEYVFVYENGIWTLNGTEVILSDYGITLTSEPETNGSITVNYASAYDVDVWDRIAVQPETDLEPITERVDKLEETVETLGENTVKKTDEASKVYGTDEEGNQTTYDVDILGLVDDVQLNGVSVVENQIANIKPKGSDVEYTNDAVSSIKNVQDALDNLLNIHYYVNPTYSTFTVDKSGSYDVGRTISQPIEIKYTVSKTPLEGDTQTLKLDGTTIYNIMSQDSSVWKSGSYTYTDQDFTSNSPKTYTFRVDYTDKHSTVPSGKTNTCSSSKTIAFYYRRYWGVTETETLSDEQLYALSNELSSSRAQDRDFNCSGGRYWWIVIPTTYCSGIQFTDVASGLPMTLPDDCISTRTITNSYGVSYSVNVYRTEYIQTSSVKIKVS